MPSPDSSPDNQSQTAAPAPSELAGLNPEELLARGMQSVRMTGGGSLTNWEPPTLAEATRLFPTYEVIDLCGRGGMGAVYKAKQPALDRIVAIKLLPLEVSVDRDFAERFVREARTMARLNHPNIVSVFEFGKTSQGHLFFVMEYVEGTTLHQMIKTVGLQPAQALEIIGRVCDALNYAHGEGVVHRDIKPANVLVDIKGRVKVTDFGLARLNSPTAEEWGQTMTGMVLGTPDYMAPEQKNGAHVDHRADIYSLGVMLYEMLCGKVPQGIFDPPSHRVPVDARVDQVVIRAMQQEPDRRYADTGEMRTDVETIRTSLDLHPLFVAPKPPAPRAPGVAAPPLPPMLRSTHAPVPAAPMGMRPKTSPGSVAPPVPGLATPPAASKKRTVLFSAIAGTSVILIGLGVWAVKKTGSPMLTSAQIASAPSVIAPVTPPRQNLDPLPISAPPEPAIVVTPVPATPVPVPTPAPVTPPPPELVATVVPAVNISKSPLPNSVEMPLPPIIAAPTPTPLPVAPPEKMVAPPAVQDWMVLSEQGDKFLKLRQRREAAAAFERALEAAENTAPPLEVAHLCQKLAGLQAAFSSAAEARGTLQRGIAVLKRSKGGNAPEQMRLIDEMESRLRSMPRD